MIHPSHLLRSDSRLRQFAAPLNLQEGQENDWGISILPCLAELFTWKKFAKPQAFIAILSLIGCSQGLLLYYFRNTSQIWAKQYNIPREISDNLIYINEFFIGVIALPITYWATAGHKIIWISSFTISHGLFAMSLSIPERFFANDGSFSNYSEQLCGRTNRIIDGTITYSGLTFLLMYQLFSATSSVAFFSIGLVYADDNSPKNKAVVLAVALASRQFGQQLGIYASWIPRFFGSENIFRSYIWQGTSMIHVILGICVAMFPRMLPSLLIKKLATSIFEFASGNTINDTRTSYEGCFTKLRRILCNKIMILSIVSTVAIQTALINFGIYDHYFKQSRFFVADDFERTGYNDAFSLNLVTNLLEQPFAILCILLTGFSISRKRLKIKYLILWNIVTFTISSLLFATYLLMRCDYGDITKLIPSCSLHCSCSTEETFHPVCLGGRTYYSPCHAGCMGEGQVDNYRFYRNCSCAAFEETASDGPCHADKCNIVYQLTQVNNIVAGGILATTYLTNIIIILNSVKRIDKSIALGLEMTLLSIVPFIPFRIGFDYVASRKLCSYQVNGRCILYSEKFNIFLSNTTVFLMLFGTIIHMLLLCIDLDVPPERRVNAKIPAKIEAPIDEINEESRLSERLNEDRSERVNHRRRNVENDRLMQNIPKPKEKKVSHNVVSLAVVHEPQRSDSNISQIQETHL